MLTNLVHRVDLSLEHTSMSCEEFCLNLSLSELNLYLLVKLEHLKAIHFIFNFQERIQALEEHLEEARKRMLSLEMLKKVRKTSNVIL